MAEWTSNDSLTVNEAAQEFLSKPKCEGHRGRLRERFLASGIGAFLDYEVVELLLTLVTPRKDCKPQAKAAMERFGSLQAVLSASSADLQKIDGIGEKNVLGIHIVQAVSQRYLGDRMASTDLIRSSRELFDYLYHRLRDKATECFTVIYLDTRNQVLAVETPFEGTVNSSHVYPREIVRSALHHHASAVLLVHNHPSGDIQPSPEDIHVTRELLFALKLMGVRVLEHLIIGDKVYYSFADRGYITRFDKEYEKSRGIKG